ncbi:SDR family oxidoreductase [Acinetobacter sp. WCHAc010052]|uniref:SDR family oxidoreductase n=1 Tax=Acinetobacter sp. WCHAc010052 TaxID=2004647 RepID=UPI000B3BDF8C|nr:SDR family oxidoreductase [Acinetobacter sp. WCHAc010052]AXY61481.1 SDR family oxidoreductase [Acinetobacter sp. WCHAc010052]
MSEKQKLKGKVVAVTGGARGIGFAIATALVAQGAKVSIGDVDIQLTKQAAEKLGAVAFELDVRDRASFAAFIEQTIAHYGQLYALVNNAGIMPMGAFLEEDPALADAQIDINFRGVVYGMQQALPVLLAQGQGHIVNIASLAGRFAIPGAAVYTGTKFAVVGMTEAVAADYRDTGVHFSAIMPSKVLTELSSGTDGADQGIPAVTPEQVAQAVVGVLVKPRLLVAVPDYLQVAHSAYHLLPAWVQDKGRRLLGDRRILEKLDKAAHAGYADRISRLTGK